MQNIERLLVPDKLVLVNQALEKTVISLHSESAPSPPSALPPGEARGYPTYSAAPACQARPPGCRSAGGTGANEREI